MEKQSSAWELFKKEKGTNEKVQKACGTNLNLPNPMKPTNMQTIANPTSSMWKSTSWLYDKT